jgi:hypothetical protein
VVPYALRRDGYQEDFQTVLTTFRDPGGPGQAGLQLGAATSKASRPAARSARSERTQTINQAGALILTGPDDLRARSPGTRPPAWSPGWRGCGPGPATSWAMPPASRCGNWDGARSSSTGNSRASTSSSCPWSPPAFLGACAADPRGLVVTCWPTGFVLDELGECLNRCCEGVDPTRGSAHDQGALEYGHDQVG